MSKRILSFSEEEYTEACYANILDNAKEKYGFNRINRFVDIVKSIFINYFPFIGHLSVGIQIYLKDNFKRVFGDLDVKTSTLSSALVTLIIAVMVGVKLDGFDVGFIGQHAGYWIDMSKYFSYIGEYLPFLGYPYGFPKIFTHIISYYLIISSIVRISYGLLDRPMGSLLLEVPIIVGKYFSKKSEFRKAAEEDIKSGKKLSQLVGLFTEKDRRVD